MRKIIIFDIDGVLVEAHGYHQALKDTVQIEAKKLGENITLSDEEIAEFEGLGISSEWHSSAACMAMLEINGKFDLSPLFKILKREQAKIPARNRLERAIKKIAKAAGVAHEHPVSLIQNSESIHSSILSTFQEMILGSAEFEKIYGIKSKLDTESYLKKFDKGLLGTDVRKRLFSWLEHSEHGCVIMTNRPSREMPDAKYAQALVGLRKIPVTGYGEMMWLEEKIGGKAENYAKPSPIHALSAVLASFGQDMDTCLLEAHASTKGKISESIARLDGYEFSVFEDTPAGLVSIGAMGDLLEENGLSVQVKKYGITPSAVKAEFLRAQEAQVFEDVNMALKQVLTG